MLWVQLVIVMAIAIGLMFGSIWLAMKFAGALWARDGCSVCGQIPLLFRGAWSNCDHCHARFCEKCGRPTWLVCPRCGGPIVRWDSIH